MKKYENYKDSGLEWLGMVPEHWEVMPIKYVLEQSNEGIKIGPFGSALTGKVSTEHPVRVYGQWNVVGKDFNAGKNFVTEETYHELSSYQISTNDILISMMGTVGKCAIIPETADKGIMDSHIVKIRLDQNKVLPEYFYYIYDKDCSKVIIEQIQCNKRGSIMDGLNSSLIKNFVITLPPLSEQRTIASYLDQKVGQIDALISEKEKMVEDLKAYRSSLITETVTKGLDKEVEMKDSGVEWIGKMPSKWTVSKLKYICKINGRIGFRGYTTDDLVSEGNGAFTIGGKHISKNLLDLSSPEYISWEKYYESPEIMVKKGDIVSSQRGTLGRTAYIDKEIGPATINPSLVLINDIIEDAKFLYWFMVSNSFLSMIEFVNTATAVPMISQTQFGNTLIPLPPISEQHIIVEYLEKEISKIDTSISELEHQLSDLKSYKSSLITEAVTGKIDLRDWQTKKS